MSLKMKEIIIGIVVFAVSMLLIVVGVIKDATVYLVVKDVLKYIPIPLGIFILMFIIVFLVLKMPNKSNGAGGVGFIMLFGIVVCGLAACAGLIVLACNVLVVADIVNCELGIMARSSVDAVELSSTAGSIWLYRLGLSLIVTVGALLIVPAIKGVKFIFDMF